MRRLILTAMVLLLGMVTVTAAAADAGIRHKEVVLYLQDEQILLDLAEQYTLNHTILEALENGVGLTFETRITMRKDGAFIWQGDTAEVILRNKLEYYPLSALYEVHRLNDDTRDKFSSLNAALEGLGLMDAIPIVSRTEIDLEPHYMVTVQTSLDVGSLPAPLRPAAYVLPRWHMQSKVWEWRLKP